jgi:hypothetical protein
VTLNEKDRLLSMFLLPTSWCKEMEACDSAGESVHYDDPSAVAWDLTGGTCLLFGWDRALQLFPQLERHLLNSRRSGLVANPAISSMVALQDFNDRPETTHSILLESIRTMPVWTRDSSDTLSTPGEKPALQGGA